MTELTDLTAEALSVGLEARQFSCRELMQATLERIERVNPRYNAIVSLRDRDALLGEAEERDADLHRGQRRGWLHGLPQAIKDVAATAGLRTTLGSPLLRDSVPRENSLMVQRMKGSGCIVIGKTNTPEFGLGSHTFNEGFGTTLNAFDSSKSAGASTGAAALDTCEQALQRVAGLGAMVEPAALGFAPERVWEAWLVWRRWLVAARIAPFLANPENRALIKPEALWEYDTAQDLTGADTLKA